MHRAPPSGKEAILTVTEIVADVAERLEGLGIAYVVGGSLASSAWGQMRQTNNADIAIRLSRSQADALPTAFASPYLISEDEIASALSSSDEFRSIQLLQMDEAFKFDLFLLHDGPYETSELDHARRVEVAPRRTVQFCAPENIVIAKLRWFVLGNRVSDRQWNDIIQVLDVQKDHLDVAYLTLWARHFGVGDLLEEACHLERLCGRRQRLGKRRNLNRVRLLGSSKTEREKGGWQLECHRVGISCSHRMR